MGTRATSEAAATQTPLLGGARTAVRQLASKARKTYEVALSANNTLMLSPALEGRADTYELQFRTLAAFKNSFFRGLPKAIHHTTVLYY